jgi:hypothetical protein
MASRSPLRPPTPTSRFPLVSHFEAICLIQQKAELQGIVGIWNITYTKKKKIAKSAKSVIFEFTSFTRYVPLFCFILFSFVLLAIGPFESGQPPFEYFMVFAVASPSH